MSGCSNPKCKTLRTKFNEIVSKNEDLTERNSCLQDVVKSLQKEVQILEIAKSEALVVARVKVIAILVILNFCVTTSSCCADQAETYKADFEEERRDRVKAEGALEDMRKEKGGLETVFTEDRAELYQEINRLRKSCSDLKMKVQETEQKHKKESECSKSVIQHMKEQMEKLTHEKNDLKNEVERRKSSQHKKLKEYDKMKEQVAHH